MGELRRNSSLLAWISTIDEMEDILFGFALKRRSFPCGEGEGRWGLVNREAGAQECDATKMISVDVAGHIK